MNRQRALTVYIIAPSLLYGALFVTLVTQFPSVLTIVELRAVNVAFEVIVALLLYTKKDQLIGAQRSE